MSFGFLKVWYLWYFNKKIQVISICYYFPICENFQRIYLLVYSVGWESLNSQMWFACKTRNSLDSSYNFFDI